MTFLECQQNFLSILYYLNVFLFMCMHTFLLLCMNITYTKSPGRSKEGIDLLELEFQVTVSHLLWVLRSEPGSYK